MIRIPSLWLSIAFLAATPYARAAEPLSNENFDEIKALVEPSAADQPWSQIPWLTSLWDARRQAAEAGKPILLWEMDGHPLGCT